MFRMLNSDFLDISNIVLFNRVLIFHLKRKLKNKSWPSSVKWFLVNFIFIFNWRIIALECCVGFCHTTTQISHECVCLYIYIYPLPLKSPSHYPHPAPSYHSSRSSRASGWAPCVLYSSFPLLLLSCFSRVRLCATP